MIRAPSPMRPLRKRTRRLRSTTPPRLRRTTLRLRPPCITERPTTRLPSWCAAIRATTTPATTAVTTTDSGKRRRPTKGPAPAGPFLWESRAPCGCLIAMKIDAQHLQRYKQLARLLWKYGRSDLVTQMGIEDDGCPPEPSPGQAALPAQLADDLEAMGPTFVKVGQVLSSRPDLLPDAYLKSLSRLQDDVKPFPYAEVERIVQEELQVRISKAFARFDPEPIAAASLGQVHAAALRDGREVVVKIQRPGIAEQIADDFEVLKDMAELLAKHTEFARKHRLAEMVEEFRISITEELDYEREAQNLRAVGENLAEF